MRKTYIVIIAIIIVINLQSLYCSKIELSKVSQNLKLKNHPIEKIFNKPNSVEEIKRSSTFEKLLILRVDFQEDNDPATTGNGKFDLRDSSVYPISVGAPPHDRKYFQETIKAVEYYYKAASLGYYHLDFSVFPTNDSLAYTLPQEMAYYNPVGVSQDVMIDRFEEYFTDVFEKADTDDEIVFSEYSHYMIIHAGSDFQHDVNGDTPSDIPSFFINMASGKEVFVDENYPISYACNIPETIAQDGNYGVINSVASHEFGHSLGFVDLYNTANNRPMVGVFDIMDSGGFGQLGIEGTNNDSVYYLEGGLPSLPSVWHRLLVWEDYFKEAGIYKEMDNLDFDELIEIAPAERELEPLGNPIYFVKIPINEDEYILIENRQVDPNQDGDIAFKGSLPITPNMSDFRVLMHPTSPIQGMDDPTYEYDWMLPGWYLQNGNSTGGGLFFWHINNKVIYDEGYVDSNGDFVSNFANNTVNTVSARRGIQIIEADGLSDIGNPYSLWWRGTAYEAFYRDKPILNDENVITGWNSITEGDGTHAGIFSSTTNPAFVSSENDPAWWKIYDISTFQNNMKFKITSNIMENSFKYNEFDNISAVSDVFFDSGFNLFGVTEENKLQLFWNSGQSEQIGWTPFSEINQSFEPVFPLQTFDSDGDENDEIIIVEENKVSFVNSAVNNEFTLDESLINQPLFCKYENITCSVYPFTDSLVVWSTIPTRFVYPISNAKLAFDGRNIIAVSENKLHRIDIDNFASSEQDIYQEVGDFAPITFYNKKTDERNIFLQTNVGDVLKISKDEVKTIFRNSYFEDKFPTQLAISDFENNNLATLTFGVGNYAFAITLDGSVLEGFPNILENHEFEPHSLQDVVMFFDTPIMLLRTTNDGYLAFDNEGNYHNEFSFFGFQKTGCQKFSYIEEEGRLYFLKADANSNLFVSYISGYDEDPILCRKNENGVFASEMNEIPVGEDEFTAFAFPNPGANDIRFRVISAKEDIQLKVFDVAGNLIYDKKNKKIENSYQDIQIDTSKLSSGVYFGVINSGNKTKKIPFGIEK